MRFSRKQIIAHRGLCHGPDSEKENTLAAIQEALDLGVMVELDIRESKSGHFVLSHDDELKDISILSNDLIILETLSPNLMTLERLIDSHHPKAGRFNLEIKDVSSLEALLSFVSNYKNMDFLISSFEDEVLRSCKDLEADIPLLLLLEDPMELGESLATEELAFNVKEKLRLMTELDALGIGIRESLVTESLVRQIKREGDYQVYAFTVNDRERGLSLLDQGVDAIFTDKTKDFLNE